MDGSSKNLKRVYLETTIPSYLAGRPSRDLLQAARQQITQDWWSLRRHAYQLHISEEVIREATKGDMEAAQRRLMYLRGIPMLTLNSDVSALASSILHSKLLPAKATADAIHVATAAVHQMDILLTWNCQHIANADIMKPLERHVVQCGYALPILCTPDELMGGDPS